MSTLDATTTPRLDAKLDFFRSPLPGAQNSQFMRWIDWILRGTSQVVFQGNWLTGLLILIAIGVNSPVYLVAAILGAAVSTATAVLFRVDRGLIDAGLAGYNGVLLAIGLNAYLSEDFTSGAWPDVRLYLYIILGSALTTVIMAALASFLGDRQVPVLTAPFVFAGWIFIFAVPHFSGLEAGPLLQAAIPEHLANHDPYTGATVFEGIFRGIGEIFFQDNWVSGALMAVGIALNSRVAAVMAIGGSALGAVVAMLYGADEATVRLGLYGFNAALTAIALGGFFFVLNGRGLLYSVFGTLVTVVAWPTLATWLAPLGMPTFTGPFVIVTWFFILAKPSFPGLAAVAPADATYPEDRRRHWKGSGVLE